MTKAAPSLSLPEGAETAEYAGYSPGPADLLRPRTMKSGYSWEAGRTTPAERAAGGDRALHSARG